MSTIDYINYHIDPMTDLSDVNKVYGPGAYRRWDKEHEQGRKKREQRERETFQEIMNKEKKEKKEASDHTEKKEEHKTGEIKVPGQLGSFFEAKI